MEGNIHPRFIFIHFAIVVNGQISVSSIILSNVPGRIQDGVEVFESAEWRKLHGRN